MSILTVSPARRRSAGFGAGGGVRHLWSEAVRAWRTRRASRAMSELSDDALHDIGVTRSEIDVVVRYGRSPRR